MKEKLMPRMVAMVPYGYGAFEYIVPLPTAETAKHVLIGLKRAGWHNVELVDLLDDSETTLIQLDELPEDVLIHEINDRLELWTNLLYDEDVLKEVAFRSL